MRRSDGDRGPSWRTDAIHSDALVFFGATGDLAYKQIFPALQAMVKHGHLNVPVIGVAKAGWNLDQLKSPRQRQPGKARRRRSRQRSTSSISLLHYIDGDYHDRCDLPGAAQAAGRRAASRALPGDSAEHVRAQSSRA